MKNFLAVGTLVALLIALLFAVSAFLARDLLLTLQKEFNKSTNSSQTNKPILARFAVLSDTHSDSDNTAKAVKQAKSLGSEFIVHTGDWTTVGTIAELEAQRRIFDKEGISYWGVMGDHDRWQSGSANFEQLFGKRYESFERNGIHHILLDASDLDRGLYKEQLDWLEGDLREAGNKPIIIYMHLPVYHPTSDRTISTKAGPSSERNSNSERFLNLIKGRKVIAMFSGDHHLSSSYTDPTTSAKIFISGAVTKDRNLQRPRFSLVEIYTDFSLSVTDQLIN